MAKLALYFATALAVVAIVLIGMMIISLKADPRYYKASAMVFVSAPQGRMIDASVWRACRRAAESDAVAQEAIERLDVSTTPEDLLGRTDGEWVETTQFFKVSYIDANPQRAQRGANTMGELVSERCVDWASPQSGLSAFVWRRARIPKEPVGTLLL